MLYNVYAVDEYIPISLIANVFHILSMKSI